MLMLIMMWNNNRYSLILFPEILILWTMLGLNSQVTKRTMCTVVSLPLRMKLCRYQGLNVQNSHAYLFSTYCFKRKKINIDWVGLISSMRGPAAGPLVGGTLTNSLVIYDSYPRHLSAYSSSTGYLLKNRISQIFKGFLLLLELLSSSRF